jgi:hypothetical protein
MTGAPGPSWRAEVLLYPRGLPVAGLMPETKDRPTPA